MSDRAWAVVVTKKNFPAILSEAGQTFDRHFLERWFAAEGDGFFVRDNGAPLDCCLFPELEFYRLYMFANGDVKALFREVHRLGPL